MANALRLVGRVIAAIFTTQAPTAPTMRRPVSELLNIGYKFAQGPHSTKTETTSSSKEAA